MQTIPGVSKKHFYEKRWFLALLTSCPPLFGTIALLIDYATSESTTVPIIYGVVLIVMLLWLIGLGAISTFSASKEDSRNDRRDSPKDLAGCAAVLWQLLCLECNVSEED